MFSMLVVGLVLTAAAQQSWIQKERDAAVHDPSTSSWVKGERPPPDHSLDLTVVVRIDDDRRSDLERTFWEVSNPQNSRYGKFLDLDSIAKVLAVPQERLELIRAHFLNSGAEKVVESPSKDMLTVSAPVVAIETALRTTLHFFSHKERTQVQIVRASKPYALPEDIAEQVVMVGELLQFPRLRSTKLKDLSATATAGWANLCQASACNGKVQPAVLAQRYKLPAASDDEEVAGNSMAVAEFAGQYFKDSDIKSFGDVCNVPNLAVATIIGGNVQSAGIEAELDIEYIKAVAPSVPLTVIHSQGSFLNWANQITSMSNPPLVHSVSWGGDEKAQMSTAFMFSSNTAFMKAGIQGMSILFSSGDDGVCGSEGCGSFSFRFTPDFPAASPYITAVGGTDFLGDDIGPEKAWKDGGGGFSDTFDIPSYQAGAVASYKSRSDANLPPRAYWNATGRGYPDVAALGGDKNPYCISTSGHFEGVWGTSASCPVVAGVFARLNGLRLKANKSPMGFLNPFIYQNPSAFQDVKAGSNNGAQGGQNYGFTAVEGWDAATGFGTPDYDALSKIALTAGVEHDVLV